jgi:hypothetical protein
MEEEVMLELETGVGFLAELWHVSAFGCALHESKSGHLRNQQRGCSQPSGRYLLASAGRLTAISKTFPASRSQFVSPRNHQRFSIYWVLF